MMAILLGAVGCCEHSTKKKFEHVYVVRFGDDISDQSHSHEDYEFSLPDVLLKYSKATRNNFATSALMHAFQFSRIFSFLRPAPVQLLIGLLRIWPLVSTPGIPVPESN
jgi:hypothetical protein